MTSSATFIPGSRVSVTTALGEKRERRVVSLGNGVVYVTTEEEFRRASNAGVQPSAVIGFPTEDVIIHP